MANPSCSSPNCQCRRPPSRSALRDPPDPSAPREFSLREYVGFVFSHLWWLVMVIGLLVVAVFCTPRANAQCDLDFTNDGFVDQGDIDAFLRVSSEGPCAVQMDGVTPDTLAPPCDSIDFNNDGSIFDPQDFEMFTAAMNGGPCPDGWYPIPRWRDQLRIWLAPSYGSDANSGIKRELAVATPERAYMLVQDAMYANRPWAVVIPRGEVIVGRFTGQYGSWAHSGSGGKPGYIGADPDDDPSLPRPVIRAEGGNGFKGYCGSVRIIGLEFRGDGCDGCVGVHFFGRESLGATDIVVSDVLVREFSGGFAFQGEDRGDPVKRVLLHRSASKWNFRVSGYAQGAFISCARGVVFDTVVLQQNGYRVAAPVDLPDHGSHNAYSVPNCGDVEFRNVVTGEPAATGIQARGDFEGDQRVIGSVALNCPLGLTAGHAQAAPDEDSSAKFIGNLVIGGGSIGPEPRSLSVGVNRAAGVVVTDNIIWRDPVEGIDMHTGAAFWLQGANHQTWTIAGNLIYEPRYNPPPVGTSLMPIVRDDRAAGSVPSAGAIITDNTILTAFPPEWSQHPPSLSDYLDQHNVQVFDPQWAGRTFGEMASRNRRGAWREEFTAGRLIEYWREKMREAE